MAPRLISLLLIAVSGLVGCEILDPGGPVQLRVLNATPLAIDEGVLYAFRDSVVFSDLEPGEATPYKEVDRAYRIATTQVVMGTDTLRLQVIDYVGEKPLDPGRYTFRLFFFGEDPNTLIQELVRDD